MKYLTSAAILAATAFAPAQAPDGTPAPDERPRLVVLCSVDQLARWVFDAARPHLAADGGFRRLLDGGVEFAACAYEHACTETGPGHATIGTGAPASVHGIVGNEWWSHEAGAKVYCVGEPADPLPDLKEGRNRGPGRLLVPTFADHLKQHVAGAKVASVSWKDRSAILMAGRSADAVAWFEASTGNLVTNTRWLAATPAWLQAFNEQRAIDGFHGWVWDRCGPAAAYEGLVDDRPYELPHQNGSNQRTLPQPITGGKPDPDQAFYVEVYASPVGNTVVRLAAEAAVQGMDLGADEVPDLLCVGFSSTDVVGHSFGPDSVEARDTLLRLDRELATFLTFLDRTVGAGRYAFFLTADHGVGPTPEWAKSRGVDAGRGALLKNARAAAEKALTARYGAPPARARWFAHVGEGSCYLNPSVLQQRGVDDVVAASRIAAAAAASTAGIHVAYATDDLVAQDAAGDPLRRALLAARHPERSGEVQLVLRPNWLDGMTPASHGTPFPYDREVVALLCGPRVSRGQRVDAPVTPGSGVVWFAAMLGLPRPAAAVDEVPAGVFVPR